MSSSVHRALAWDSPHGLVPCRFMSSRSSFGVPQHRFSSRLSAGSPFKWRHHKPAGRGPTNASNTRTCTDRLLRLFSLDKQTTRWPCEFLLLPIFSTLPFLVLHPQLRPRGHDRTLALT